MPELPDDMSHDERRYFELTGSLEMYELRKKADGAARERIRINQENAERKRLEEHMHALRSQAADEEAELARVHSNGTRALPGKNPWHETRAALVGSESLPEDVKRVIIRIFMTIPEWTPENQQGLVNLLLAMGPHRSSAWAAPLIDGIASDSYGGLELTPMALLRGSTGLKQIAGPGLMGEMRALGGDAKEPRALGGGKRGRSKGRKKKDTPPSERRVVDGIIEPRQPKAGTTPQEEEEEEIVEEGPYGYTYIDDGADGYDEAPHGTEGLDAF